MQRVFIPLFLLFILIYEVAVAQHNNQSVAQIIRGIVVDKQTQTPLPGANVIVLNTQPPLGSTTNANGEFRIEHVPLGRQGIQISFIGYSSTMVKNLIVNSAKETVVYIELEEKVETTEEVMVVGNARKDQTMNKMASVSARTLTVEEAGRYAGSREDVARMAMNFAGVSGANDSRNDIIVRGNTPSGILWRLEDVDIPNPNHFAASGTTGGPVGMLNSNTLRNSDFFTGAFPAEYSNVFSGVFDLNMRVGNNEKHEFLGQIGFNGIELGAEGPFSKGGKSSFLANYRYSTLQIFDLLGINFGTSGIPNYQDLNFNMNFPVKKGKITWFGLAGKSSITMLDSNDNSTDLYTNDGMDLINGSSLVASGLSYTRFYNETTYGKFILSYVNQNGFTNMDQVKTDELPQPYYNEDNTEEKLTFRAIFNKKFSRHFSNRTGFTLDRLAYHLNAKIWDDEINNWESMLNNKKSFLNSSNLYRAYSQFLYKFSDQFEVKPGISVMYLGLNDSYAVEPRIGLNWKTGYRTSLNFGYGKHSKMQSLATYYIETLGSNGSVILFNQNLDFTKTHHWVLGFDALLSDQLRFKAETYYQYLYDVPVEKDPDYYSMVNAGAGWGLNTRYTLVNKGEAWNYGIEFTLEKFYLKNYYFLGTFTLFDSKYTGSDGVKRNTAFNGNFVVNTLTGKEFPINNKSTLVFDLKMTWAGGNRFTPIDVEASRNSNDAFGTEYFEDQAYSRQFPNYFKADVKIGFRLDGQKISQLWEFYVENVTNHKNPLNQLYSSSKDEITTIYQLGFFPLFNYRIYF